MQCTPQTSEHRYDARKSRARRGDRLDIAPGRRGGSRPLGCKPKSLPLADELRPAARTSLQDLLSAGIGKRRAHPKSGARMWRKAGLVALFVSPAPHGRTRTRRSYRHASLPARSRLPLRRRPRPDLVPSHNRPNPRCTDLATCAQGVGHMTRGGRHRAWTTREVAFLIDAAGRLPLRTICKRLGRSESAVESMASKLNRSGEHLTLKCWSSRLVWCNECATWRTGIDDKTGRCRVCTMREQLRGREDACSRELAIMTPEQRLVYERTEAQRRTRKALERPQKRGSCPMSRYERSKAEERYLIDLEEWEYRTLRLRYDAAKTRLRRMREKTGRNPRKGRPPSPSESRI